MPLVGLSTGVSECDRLPGTEYRTVPPRQCHGQALLMPAILGAGCCNVVMGLLLPVGGMSCHNPANPLLHGVELPL